MEQKYRVIKDLQGGDFAMDRVYTIDGWRKQAIDWAVCDEHYGVAQTLKDLEDTKVLHFIGEYWSLEFGKVEIQYYVEFESTESEKPYSLQSKWFDTKEDAIRWYINSFDYVDANEICVRLMSAILQEDYNYGDIKFEEDITAKCHLRGDN